MNIKMDIFAKKNKPEKKYVKCVNCAGLIGYFTQKPKRCALCYVEYRKRYWRRFKQGKIIKRNPGTLKIIFTNEEKLSWKKHLKQNCSLCGNLLPFTLDYYEAHGNLCIPCDRRCDTRKVIHSQAKKGLIKP